MSSRKSNTPGVQELLGSYNAGVRKKYFIIMGGILLMVILGLVFTTVGENQVSLSAVLTAIRHWIAGDLSDT